jgi:hypothetical protein
MWRIGGRLEKPDRFAGLPPLSFPGALEKHSDGTSQE